ncbi:MAG: hypothetical protein N2C12_12890, partial [Planctomycetales bacterium]
MQAVSIAIEKYAPTGKSGIGVRTDSIAIDVIPECTSDLSRISVKGRYTRSENVVCGEKIPFFKSLTFAHTEGKDCSVTRSMRSLSGMEHALQKLQHKFLFR